MYSNIVKTYEMLLSHELRIRNTCVIRNIFRSQMKNAVSYMRIVTVFLTLGQDLPNFADDNTITAIGKTIESLVHVLETKSESAII